MLGRSVLITTAILLFFILRIGLMISLPIFNDESIYLHWGRIFTHHVNEAFFATELDGKPPGTAIFFGILTILPFDPLLTVRFVNILLSLVSAGLLFSLFKKFVSVRFAPLFLFLVATNPFLVLFDTLALQEPSITFLSTLLLAFSISLIQKPTLIAGLAIGAVGALGLWVKPNMQIFFPGVFIALFLTVKAHRGQIPKIIPTFLGMVAAFLFLFLPLRLHPLWQMIEKKTSERAFSFIELFLLPFDIWIDHIKSAIAWCVGYGTLPVFLLSIAGIILCMKKEKYRFLILWTLLPIVITILTGRMLTARYIVYTIPVALMFSTIAIMKLPKYRTAVASIAVAFSLITSLVLSFSPLSFYRFLAISPQTQNDFKQYVSGWPSGYGVKDAMQFLDEEEWRSSTPIILTVRLDSGNPEDAVYLYGERITNAIVLPENDIPHILIQMKPMNVIYPMYFVSRGDQHGFFKPCMTELKKFAKPLDEEYVGVYSIDQACAMSLIDAAMKN